jgi:hypothetical protein
MRSVCYPQTEDMMGYARSDIGKLGTASRRPQGSRSDPGHPRSRGRTARCILGLPAQDREPVFRLGAGGAGRSHEAPTPRAWHFGIAGHDGPVILF